MGTWALPNTKESTEQLSRMFEKPICANNKTKAKLYNILGDDKLFDDINSIGKEYGSKHDIRFMLKASIENLLIYYKEQPECFYIKFDSDAVRILENIVKDYK